MIKTIKVEDISTEGTQSRVKMSREAIESYADQYRENDEAMPPVVVFFDGKSYYLGDGFHRLEGCKLCGFALIRAEVLKGTKRDALKHSLNANASHGVRPTPEDRRNAVRICLLDEEWSKLSDREIGIMCSVSHPTVGKIRKEMFPIEEPAHIQVPDQPEPEEVPIDRNADSRRNQIADFHAKTSQEQNSKVEQQKAARGAKSHFDDSPWPKMIGPMRRWVDEREKFYGKSDDSQGVIEALDTLNQRFESWKHS